jgi:ribonuclease HI
MDAGMGSNQNGSNPRIEAWFDGVCEPWNPGGHGAYGAVVKVNGEVALREGGYVGVGPGMSNNVAEYAGVLRVLEFIAVQEGNAVVRGDSKLVIMQLTGEWKAKQGLYLETYRQAAAALAKLGSRVRLEWVGRDQNSECDDLSKQVLRERGVKFRLQPE